ncbi:MAG TPA: hypothetical protein VEI97_00400 [bacterium]|nr:hypothetical protein [bacterium]
MANVQADVAQRFLALYRAAFAPLEAMAPARQAMTEEEFLHAMDDPSVVKFVGWDWEGQACAMAVMATDLSVVPWISPPYFEARFPEHYQRGAIYYFYALLVRPENQGGPWARLLLEELTRMVGSDRAVAAFDCCSYTVDVTKLPEMIARVADRHSYLHPIELDRQHYFAYVLQGLR